MHGKSKYRNENSDGYIRNKSLEFIVNFITNHSGSMGDSEESGLFQDIKRHGADVFAPAQLHRACQIVLGVEGMKMADTIAKRRADTGDVLASLFSSGGWRERNLEDILQLLWNMPHLRKNVRALITLIFRKSRRDSAALPRVESATAGARLLELQNSTGISDIQKEIVLLMYLFSQGYLSYMKDRYSNSYKLAERLDCIAKSLDCPVADVQEALAARGKLKRYGIIDKDLEFNRGHGINTFLSGLRDQPIDSAFYQKIEGEPLPWEFYGELARKHGAVLKRMIAGRSEERGLNILLYGEPGTGKTSFAQSLASELGLVCYNIAQNNRNGSDPEIDTPGFRFGALQLCADRVDSKRSLLIVDEADKMLRNGGDLSALLGKPSKADDNKGLLNTVLDNLKATVIWISNTSADELETSSRRRFDYSVFFGKLNTAQRRLVWENAVSKHKLGELFDSETVGGLAERHEISAGGISIVLQNVAALAPQKAEAPTLAGQLIAQHCELMEIKNTGKSAPSRDYSLDGLNIKGAVKLPDIVAAIRRFQTEMADAKAEASPDTPRMNLLLSGPPGTGKTEFVKYLGRTLDTKVLVRMGSDLLSMWVGGTEKNIAAAFREATAEKAILFLDEIDGLMQSRAGAQRSWEVTQVNELLHQMENFNGVLVGATNFIKNLDEAASRRFTFKLQFDWLDAPGKRLFFERMFKASLTTHEAARLSQIPNLAPGDFRAARQGLYYLGGSDAITNAARLEALERESEAKANNAFAEKRKIGF